MSGLSQGERLRRVDEQDLCCKLREAAKLKLNMVVKALQLNRSAVAVLVAKAKILSSMSIECSCDIRCCPSGTELVFRLES